MLREKTLWCDTDKVQTAIDRLRAFEPKDAPYWLAFSGGKDSVVIYHLAQQAGVNFDAHYNLTTADPPEVVRFIKDKYPDVSIDKPEMSMWRLIGSKTMPPTRTIRYCCRVLKERGGQGRFVITGVRWAESTRRKANRKLVELNAYTPHVVMLNNDNDESRRMVEFCQVKSKHVLNDIIDWTDEDVWEYIRENNIETCSLYEEGFKRIGCVGCPMKRKAVIQDFERWPSFKRAYLKAFERMLETRKAKGLDTRWSDAQDVFNWWLSGRAEDDRELLPGIGNNE